MYRLTHLIKVSLQNYLYFSTANDSHLIQLKREMFCVTQLRRKYIGSLGSFSTPKLLLSSFGVMTSNWTTVYFTLSLFSGYCIDMVNKRIRSCCVVYIECMLRKKTYSNINETLHQPAALALKWHKILKFARGFTAPQGKHIQIFSL